MTNRLGQPNAVGKRYVEEVSKAAPARLARVVSPVKFKVNSLAREAGQSGGEALSEQLQRGAAEASGTAAHHVRQEFDRGVYKIRRQYRRGVGLAAAGLTGGIGAGMTVGSLANKKIEGKPTPGFDRQVNRIKRKTGFVQKSEEPVAKALTDPYRRRVGAGINAQGKRQEDTAKKVGENAAGVSAGAALAYGGFRMNDSRAAHSLATELEQHHTQLSEHEAVHATDSKTFNPYRSRVLVRPKGWNVYAYPNGSHAPAKAWTADEVQAHAADHDRYMKGKLEGQRQVIFRHKAHIERLNGEIARHAKFYGIARKGALGVAGVGAVGALSSLAYLEHRRGT